jgi:hypothetical protein
MRIDHRPVHLIQRTCLWLGVVAIVYAGGTAVYGQIVHRYQSSMLDRARAGTAVRSSPDAAADLREGTRWAGWRFRESASR